MSAAHEAASASPPIARWAKVIDQTACIGCHACTTACRSENEVPISVTRTYVKSVDVGVFPQARRAFQVTRCNQCEDPPCVAACPTAAMHRRADGIVDFDKSVCIGCKACIAACPYDAIFINPDDHTAEKCNLCAHRLDMGLEPACVVVCPVGAIVVGDLDDPASAVARAVHRQPVQVRRPEKGTRPTLFYLGAHQATLDPLAARQPDGGLFMWSERGTLPHQVPPLDGAGAPADALLSYDVPHRAPWDWRVSLYTWTKGMAAGAYLVPLLLALAGRANWSGPLFAWAAPVLAGLFLAATGLVLIWDLERPGRFHLIFLRPQPRSWLVRGAFAIGAYAAVLGAHFLAGLLGWRQVPVALAAAGLPLAVATAAYTGWLFAQARGRDLWQSPLLPPHLVVQALLAGAAVLLPVAALLEPRALPALAWLVAAAALAHLLLVAAEATVTHPTAHAHLAARTMTHGRLRPYFWAGAALVAVGLLAPAITWWAAVPVLAGLLVHEHAHVQAGQSVPLA
jgi:Fe-S-cluster-containing dehydrogenase component/formate-dependent nitrite reductase membrane component NrfD